MRDAIGAEAMHARTGHVAEAFHVGPKVLWLRRHRPDVYAATRRFLQPRDVVLRRLTGRVATDETHADATMFFDLRARRWADDLLGPVRRRPGALPGGAAALGDRRGAAARRPRPRPACAPGSRS